MILKIDQGRLFVNDTEITIFPRKVFDGVALIRQPSSTLVSSKRFNHIIKKLF